MQDFLPPFDNSFAVGLAKLLVPLAQSMHKLEIRVSPRCKQLVETYAPKHTVIAANHSDRFDPLCAYALAKDCTEEFYFLASREQFDQNFGFSGWLMQQVGTYSVIRGRKVDVPSAEKTIDILVEGKRNLVQFPEGDVTGRNDVILPLKKDGMRNMFEAQRRLLTTGESLYVLPVAMYYQVESDAIPAMNRSIVQLERWLNLPVFTGSESQREQRIKRLVFGFIEHQTKFYGVQVEKDQSLSDQLRSISRAISTNTASANNVEYDADENEALLLYGVRAELKDPRNSDLDRAEQLLILASTLENQTVTDEIAWRVLDRLEKELTGKVTNKGNRIAFIDAAPPVDLKPLYPQFIQDQVGAMAELDAQVRASLTELMQQMQTLDVTPGLVHAGSERV